MTPKQKSEQLGNRHIVDPKIQKAIEDNISKEAQKANQKTHVNNNIIVLDRFSEGGTSWFLFQQAGKITASVQYNDDKGNIIDQSNIDLEIFQNIANKKFNREYKLLNKTKQ